MRIHLLPLLITFLIASFLSAKEQEHRNVIVFLVDDWGWTDAAVLGSDLFETPNIDRLANEGARFTDAYAACTVCSPTRAAMMTGMYPARLNVTDWIAGHTTRFENTPMDEPDWTQYLDHNLTTVAEALNAAGYKTANIGKWHLTPKGEPGAIRVREYYPEHHGFDINIGGNQYGAPGSYFFPGWHNTRWNMPIGREGDYLTDRLTDEALVVLEAWKDEPFFIYMPYYTVHTPIQGKQEYTDYYAAKIKEGMRHTNPTYAAMVQSLDESIGRITQYLEENGLMDNTLIILTGDNGGLDPNDSGSITDNAPLRNGKGSIYEGGTRVPGIVHLPGAPDGLVIETPIITMDFYPTILNWAGVEGHPHHNQDVDGVDILPLLHGQDMPDYERDLFWHYPHYHTQGARPYTAIRSAEGYKLIQYHKDGTEELYHLPTDIGEKEDLVDMLPEKVFELRQRMNQWRDAMQAQMAIPNPDYDASKPTLPPGYARRNNPTFDVGN